MVNSKLTIGYFSITENDISDGFDITVSDIRTGINRTFPGLSLLDYDQLMDDLENDQSVDCLDRLSIKYSQAG